MKFKVGDKVRIVNVKHDCKKYLEGKVVTIKKGFKGVGNGYVYDVGKEYLFNEPELEFTRKFKKGDKVEIIAANHGQPKELIGNIYIVTTASDYDYMLDSDGGWYWGDDDLKLATKPKFNHEDYEKGKYAIRIHSRDQAIIFDKYFNGCKDYKVGGSWNFLNDYTDISFNLSDNRHSDTDYYKITGYTILEFEDFDWSDFTMEKKFTKADLKNGDVVKFSDEEIGIVCVDTGTIIFKNGFDNLSNVSDDLKFKLSSGVHIIAVRRPTCACECQFCAFDYDDWGELVYERKEVEEMTLEEVCKALGKEIKIVKER